jgi:hypothetical protein
VRVKLAMFVLAGELVGLRLKNDRLRQRHLR